MEPPASAILVVFFEGTANTLAPVTTQIGAFAAATAAIPLNGDGGLAATAYSAAGPFKLSFDGCGVTSGVAGIIFAQGLDAQCRVVAAWVRKLAAGNNLRTARRVRVVGVGLSRGGIACMKLARVLAAKDTSSICELRLLLFDPVPGNCVSTGFPFTAHSSRDLRDCTNLRSVLAIYPHEPLPDIAMHAPVLPVYPETCLVEVDVTLGCHQGALFDTVRSPSSSVDRASNLSFDRIRRFLESNDVTLDFTVSQRLIRHLPSARECLDLCRDELQQNRESRRILHDAEGRGRIIVRLPPFDSELMCFLNRHHELLEKELGKSAITVSDPPRYMLDMKEPQDPGSCSLC